ncbi:hypothetical protein SAMN05216368_1083 [Cryobacterium flavum]|uniref:Uncharacterized protein n=1 Tax=Cryobacterium flavum TaxID=1424659 RepID=A0A5E9G0X4_9MICO|nr:hypothetical protein SAMN05216368_1083 [Cryobacterium flavum]
MWWSAWWRHHTLMPKVGSRRSASLSCENATSEIAGLYESGNGRECQQAVIACEETLWFLVWKREVSVFKSNQTRAFIRSHARCIGPYDRGQLVRSSNEMS